MWPAECCQGTHHENLPAQASRGPLRTEHVGASLRTERFGRDENGAPGLTTNGAKEDAANGAFPQSPRTGVRGTSADRPPFTDEGG